MQSKRVDCLKIIPQDELIKRRARVYENQDGILLKCINSIPLRLPRFLTVDENLGIFVGLILTEGLQSQRGKSRNSFVLMNTDCDIIDICLKLLKSKFQIESDVYKFRMYLPHNLFSEREKIVKGWRNRLGIERKIQITIYKQMDLKKPKFAIFIYRTFLRMIVDNLIRESLKLIDNDKEFALGFLKGVFAAEGSVEIKRNKSLKAVYFSQNNDENRKTIEKAVSFFEIPFKERIGKNSRDIRITHLRNFEIINKINLCSISGRKKEAFEKGLNKLKKSPCAGRDKCQTKNEIVELLKKEGPLSVSQIAKKLDRSYYTIWDHVFRKSRFGNLYNVNINFRYKNRKEKLLEVIG